MVSSIKKLAAKLAKIVVASVTLVEAGIPRTVNKVIRQLHMMMRARAEVNLPLTIPVS